MKKMINLAFNENVLGPSPRAMEAIQNAASRAHLYPTDQENVLLEKLAAQIGGGLGVDNFLSGNGSCDVLRMLVLALLSPDDKAVIAAPTFGIYQMLVTMFGGEAVNVPLRDFTVDLPALLRAIDSRTKLVFICNPNNPTGTYITHHALALFLDQVPPHVTLILDEAYMEFAHAADFPRATEFVAAGKKLFVTRTFSKLHGLAGLRVGYGFGPVALAEQIRQRKLHFNSGGLVWSGAAAAVDDHEFISRSIEMVSNARKYYATALDELKIGYVPTQSNFLLLKNLPVAAPVLIDAAKAEGLLLNHTSWSGLDEHVRITFADPEVNQRVVRILARLAA